VTSEVTIHPCESWDSFITVVRSTRFGGFRLFRGHADPQWKLSSHWERILWSMKADNPERNVRALFGDGAYEKIRDGYLDRFKHHAWEIQTDSSVTQGYSENEWWAIGRHHGLITPLLDWTFSPFVAAYFAFTDALERANPGFQAGHPKFLHPSTSGNICVWELNFVPEAIKVASEFELVTPRPSLARRQVMQRGAFTRLTHDIYVDIESYLKSKGKSVYLARYDIELSEYRHALADFRSMGISQVLMFQDLDGAARQSNMQPSITKLTIMAGR
jgi:hypothetical protein